MRYLVCAFGLTTLFFVGCNSDPTRVAVKGKVTLDGKTIENGLVEFIPADGKTPSAKGGAIVGGQYSAEIVPGDVIVKITSPIVVGKKPRYGTPDSPVDDVLAEQIPKKYNEETTLKEKISTERKEINFELKSQ